jgi:mono/diheme cytochrome c family protein
MRTTIIVVAVLLVLVAAAAAVAYSGAYNVAADEPHWPITQRVLAIVRERSIETRSRQLSVPDLADEKRIVAGAKQYAEMCESCHLAPGVQDSELRRGLFPKPPELARERSDPRRAFWIVKHGIKATGMPAWGPTHSDDVLWSVVAFMQKLPELDATSYRQLLAKASPRKPTPAGREQDGSDGTHKHRH